MNIKRKLGFVFAAIIGVSFGAAVIWVAQNARYEAVRTSYGGQRMTRTEAMAIRNDPAVDWLPDSEFLPEPQPPAAP